MVSIDLSSPGAAEDVTLVLAERRITVDMLVNNAGFGTHGAFARDDPQEQLRMLQVNVIALTTLTRLLLPGMIERRRGRVLNVASTAAFQPGPLMAVYYAKNNVLPSPPPAGSEHPAPPPPAPAGAPAPHARGSRTGRR